MEVKFILEEERRLCEDSPSKDFRVLRGALIFLPPAVFSDVIHQVT